MSKTLLLHGQFETLSSFALVNRRLAAGLRALGYDVTMIPSDGALQGAAPATEPDIYLAHDHPYDMRNAFGKVNAFFLEYDYARVLKRDAPLVERLNHFFDVVLAPSEFVRTACVASGVTIPIVVCPLGFDPAEFNSALTPKALPTRKRFKFLYLGGANERKGTDLLVRAYGNEFCADDDVVLVLKTFGYEHLRAEFETLLARVQKHKDAPEIIYAHGDAASIAGYFTAADCGVFPFRGEGFALPILEALACGCPVLVTDGGGPRDYCSARNATFIPAKQVTRRGKLEYAPDMRELQRLMRAAYARGARPARERKKISASVADWTWTRTMERLDAALPKPHRVQVKRAGAPQTAISYAFFETGETSWKKEAQLLDRALARCTSHAGTFAYARLSFRDAPLDGPVRVMVGESGFALEHFVRAARLNPTVKRILRRNSGPFATMVARDNAERVRCGVPPRVYEPLDDWRNERESALADEIIVPSRASRRLFLKEGYAADKLRIVALGLPAPRRVPPRRGRTLRFLFIGTNPFRKGIRVLMEAWDALQPREAELVCVVNTEILQSTQLLRYLVRNESITVKPRMARRELEREYLQCDCQVLPSFEDGFGVAVGDGMALGKPAIVSRDTGISDLITHLENGYVVPTGSVSKLKEALAYFCAHREQIGRMGAAAQETARAYSYTRFQQATLERIQARLTHG